jgi:hypothetical protein
VSFLGGALVGAVVGLGAGVLLGRRGRSGTSNAGAIAIVIAAVALVASGVALSRSGRKEPATSAAVAIVAGTTTTTTSPTVAASTTTPGTATDATVSVPNVVGSGRDDAVTTLEKIGLKPSVETLSLANVPDGFVISQSPLPAAVVTVGSTVSLVVSSAT